MPLDFPNSPTTGQIYGMWQWDGSKWITAGGNTGGPFLPLGGGTVSPGPLTVTNTAASAGNVIIQPVGQYELPPSGPSPNPSFRSAFTSYVNTAQNGGHYSDATMNAGMYYSTVYGAPNYNVFNLVGITTFQGTGGTGQHCAIVGYGNRTSAGTQPTTTVAATLSAPGYVVQVADVTNLQVPYAMPILINGHSYGQIGVSGTSGPGTITLATQVSVADGTAGNTVQGNNNPQIWGANIAANDRTGLPSSKTNALIGIELDIAANGLDDSNVRSALTIVANTIAGGSNAEFNSGIALVADTSTTIKQVLQMNARFSQSLLDTRSATQLSGAHAVWLADGQNVAWNTAGTAESYWDTAAMSGAGAIHHSANVQVDGTLYAPNGITAGSLVVPGSVSGAGFTSLFASPPPIGSTTAAAGHFTTLGTTGQIVANYSGGGIGSAVLVSNATTPAFGWNDSAQGADAKIWDAISIFSTLTFRAVNDAGSAATNWLQVTRSGYVPQTITLTAPSTVVSGVLTVGAGATTWNSGTGAPATTRPVGSMYSRTDGAVGSTLYVSRGGGTWAAVAGV